MSVSSAESKDMLLAPAFTVHKKAFGTGTGMTRSLIVTFVCFCDG